MMKRCPDCNKRLRNDTESCPRCGWKKADSILNFSAFLTGKKPPLPDSAPIVISYFIKTRSNALAVDGNKAMIVSVFGCVSFPCESPPLD